MYCTYIYTLSRDYIGTHSSKKCRNKPPPSTRDLVLYVIWRVSRQVNHFCFELPDSEDIIVNKPASQIKQGYLSNPVWSGGLPGVNRECSADKKMMKAL
jgi:hypothetical protein